MSEYIITTEQLNFFLKYMNDDVMIPANIAHLKPIVRCRDCRYGCECIWPTWFDVPGDYLDCTGELVELWDYHRDQPKMNPVPPDGYCYWGERKE